MSKNLIYLCKNKLASIDSILPVLMEIKKLYPKTNFIVVFLNNRHLNAVKRNHNIWNAIQSIDSCVYAIRARNKFGTLVRLVKFTSRLCFHNNIIIREADVFPLHNIVMKILKKLSKTKEIKAYLSIQSPNLLKNIYIQSLLSRERDGRHPSPDFFNGRYDYFLSSLSPSQFKDSFNAQAPEQKMIKVGYIRKLPGWQRFMGEAVRRNKIINNSPYFLYILHATYQRRSYLQEPDLIELIEESLNVLKKYNKRIKTIFKPHTVTDIKAVKNLLNKINYSNYVIDYSHPMVLSSKAKFIFGNVYSCTMFDAYYQGIPVVEYCQYDPELFARIGKQSIGSSYCDFFIYRDKERLDEVLNKLINNEVKIERDPKFIQDNFPDTPREFYEFWNKLLL